MATLIGDGAHAQDIRWSLQNHDLRVFPHHTDWDGSDPGDIIIAINDPWVRARVAQELNVVDLLWVHPQVNLGNDITIHYGTHVNYAVSMTRTTIGKHVTVSPGVTICGDVTIGNRVLIGAGATICDRVTIGDDVTIGAGCVVLPESVVDSGATIIGVPARHLATGVHVK